MSDLATTPTGQTRANLDRRAPLMQAVMAQAAMELRLMMRSGESLLVTLGIPLGILLFFSNVDILPTGNRDPVVFLVPGVLAISVMSTAFVAQGIQTAFERKYGVLKRLGASPLTRTGYLGAKILSVLGLLSIQTALILAIAVFGLDWSPGSGGILGVLLGLLVGTASFTALGLLVAGTLRAEATLAVVNALYLVLMLVSGVMFEADALPGRMASLGELLPSGALGEVLRTSLDTGVIAWGALVLLAGWGVVAAAVTARAFRWDG
jgi:ABC-2 type transport system permease protein